MTHARRDRSVSRARCEPIEPRLLLAGAGTLDASFSGDGKATLASGNGVLDAQDNAVQSDGKVIVVGTGTASTLARKMVVARYNADGSLDATFGPSGTGFATAEFGNPLTSSTTARAVAIQADDRIVVVGTTTMGTASSVATARFTAGGLLDASFSLDGKHEIDDFDDVSYDNFASEVVIQQNGRIVVAATTSPDDTGTGADFAVARYNVDGTLDNSFAGNGRRRIDMGQEEWVSGLTIDYSGTSGSNANFGKLLLVGYQSPSSNASLREFAVLRLNTNGTTDGGFSGDGTTIVPFGGAYTSSAARDVVVQDTGKIVVTGEVGGASAAGRNTGVIRLNANGTGDPTFGVGNGQIEIDFLGQDVVTSLLIGQSGKLFVGGTAGGGGYMTLACLTADGTFDRAFSDDGRLGISFDGNNGTRARGLARAPGGTIVASGGPAFATARFFDRAFQTVSIGTFNTVMSEQGTVGTGFIVTRLERLTTPLRVFIGTGGAATPPNSFPIRPRDYNGTGISFGNGQTSSTYVDIPADGTFVSVGITPVDDAVVEGDELATFGVFANAGYDVVSPTLATLVIRDNDIATAPVVNASSFQFERGPQSVSFRFNQNVHPSVGDDDFVIAGPANIPAHAFAHDQTTNTTTLTFGGILPDGDYTVTARAAGIATPGNLAMAADHTLSFFFVNADANRDRAVNFDDLLVLAQNYGNIDRTFSQGNFDYSANGAVGFDDLLLLAQRYGTSLSVAALPQAKPALTDRRRNRAIAPALLA